MSGRESSRRETLWQAAVVVLIMVAAGLLLFWLHVSAREATLKEQNFRLLGDMTEHIRDSFAVLDTALKNAVQKRPEVGLDPISQRKPAKTGPTISTDWSVDLTNLIAQIEPPPTLLKLPPQPGKYVCSKIEVEREPRSYQLNLTYARSTDQTLGLNSNDSFTVQTDLGQMLRAICDKREFDDVVIVNTNREVEFQFSQSLDRATNSRARGNLIVRKLDPVTDKEKTNISTVATSLLDLQLGGETFKVFVQPLLFSAGAGQAAQVNWCVCGLVRNNTFRARTWEMSPTAIVAFLFVAIGFLLLWPLLNVGLSGTWEELRPRHVVAVLVSSFCICAALSLLLLYSNTRLYSEMALDGQVESLAGEVQSNLRHELSKMEALLSTLDKYLLESAKPANSYDASLTWADIRRVPKLYLSVTNLADFPPFSDVSWLGEDGMQVAKATPSRSASSLISIRDRNYYLNLRDRRAWLWSQFAFPDPKRTNDFDFYVESVFSKTRNENCAVLSRRFSLVNQWPTPVCTNDFFQPAISTITFQPISLFGVVLPAGCGFCLFERNGRVCFHSDEQLNLRENFIVENDRNRRLLAAIESRTSDHFDSHYHNATHHVFVMPLAGTSLTIAAFRNESPIAMLHRNMVLVAATLLVLLVVLPLLFIAAIAAATITFLPREKRSFLRILWPHTRDRVCYAQYLIWAIVTVVVCSALLQLSQSPAALLVAGIVAPILGFLVSPVIVPILSRLESRVARRYANLSAILFKQYPFSLESGLSGILKKRSSTTQDPEATNRLAHLLFLALALVLLGVLPTFACYRLASWQETAAFIKSAQFRLARDFQERRVQVWIKNKILLGADDNVSYWKDTSGRRLRSEWGSYLDPWQTWIQNNTASIPAGGGGARTPETAAQFYRACFLPLEETDLGTGGFVLGQAADRSWLSDLRPDKLLMLIAGGTQISSKGTLKVVSALPRGGWLNIGGLPPLEDGWHLLWYGGLLTVFLVPFLLVSFIGKHLLLFDLPHKEPNTSQDWTEKYDKCTLQEKLTLYQIARTGFANGSRPEVRKLVDEGLIGFDPAVTLAQGLRQHVLDHFKPGDQDRAVGSTQDAAKSGWGSIRVIIGLTITAGAIFLFLTQQQLWQLALGFVSTFATATQDITKARMLFAKNKPEPEK